MQNSIAFGKAPRREKKILVPSAKHLQERAGTGRQAGRQDGRQAGSEAGGTTRFFFYGSLSAVLTWTRLSQWGAGGKTLFCDCFAQPIFAKGMGLKINTLLRFYLRYNNTLCRERIVFANK